MMLQKYSRKIISLSVFFSVIVGGMLVASLLQSSVQVLADHGRETKENQKQPNKEMLLQSQPQLILKQDIESVQHDAQGHEQHQVVYIQKYDDGTYYSGTVSFNSTLPVDIISFVDGSNSANNSSNSNNVLNSSKPFWHVKTNVFSPTTLLKNATTGTDVEFAGNGLVAHRAHNDTFNVDYNLTIFEILNNNTSFVSNGQ